MNCETIDIMLDLETLGNTPNAVVVQIGACYFDRFTGEIGSRLQIYVDAQNEVEIGFTMDASTILWWLSQSKSAQDLVFNNKEEKLGSYRAFKELNKFTIKGANIWSHSTFDFVIMMNHFNKLEMSNVNTNFRKARDLRTIVDLARPDWNKYKRVGTHHNALDDCLYQVKYTVDCLNKLRG